MTPKMTAHLGRYESRLGQPTALAHPPLTGASEAPLGFVRNARVVTTRGLCCVQDLRQGDRLVTRAQGVVSIDRIERQSLVSRAVYVLSGSLGHFQTDRDSLLPAGQPVLVRDWRARALGHRHEVIATAERLVDGEFIRDLGYLPMTLFQVFCTTPQILYADGMELVSADPMSVQTA